MNLEHNTVNRRGFLSSVAGAFVAASARSPAVQNEGRPFCCDCQSHLFVPEIVARMAKRHDDPAGLPDNDSKDRSRRGLRFQLVQ